MTGSRKRAGVVVAALAATLLAVPAVPAAAVPSEVALTTATEAWYHTAPAAALSTLPPTNPYPAETLHVGIAGGQEESRTDLRFDVSPLGPEDVIEGGTLLLPVDVADSRSPETADLRACAVTETGPSVQGSFAEPPEADCSIRSPAVFEPGDEPSFTVDLFPFNDVLTDGGLALVASERSGEALETWHVAFYGRDNESADARPIIATVTVTAPDPVDGGFGPLPLADPPPPVEPAPPPQPGIELPSSPETPALPPTEPPLASPPVVPAAQGFAYSVVWAIPLGLLVMALYLVKALTREVAFPLDDQ